MNISKLFKHGIDYLRNQEIEIRIRMLFFLEYAAFFSCIIGTIVMIAFATSIKVMIPNFILIIFCLIGLYLSHTKKNPDAAAVLIVCGCAYIALPFMFFTAGGFRSGMPIWFLFGVIFIFMMLKGKLRFIMSGINLIIAVSCIICGYLKPEWVTPLKNSNAEFWDMLQSFVIVSVIVCICLYIYITAYDRQKTVLIEQSKEIKEAMYNDALTGVKNRRAYYEAVSSYSDGLYSEDLVLVAMDVNGLKMVNDNEGHAAGDELLVAASGIMVEAYKEYGQIYRTGGDEFIAVLHCNGDEVTKLDSLLTETVANTNSLKGSNISIASGIVAWKDNDVSFFELEKLADKYMYENKSAYYRESGMDRRRR